MSDTIKKIMTGFCFIGFITGTGINLSAQSLPAPDQKAGRLHAETPRPSIGPDNLRQIKILSRPGYKTKGNQPPADQVLVLGSAFEAFNFDDNATENDNYLFIPPDPIGAAGLDRLLAVGNVMIESRDKSGTLLWRDALRDFFSPLSPATFTFDPKIVYDHYEDRFLVIALERVSTGYNPDPGNMSRILLAVSKTAAPATATATDWYYYAIDAEESIGGVDHWVDYPGFEVDEEAVYITGNMFAHPDESTTYRVHLWIVDKGLSGGLYDGGSAVVTRNNPYDGGGFPTTTMPALIYGQDGAGSGIGTYLVSYSGLTDGSNEFVQVVRVDDPLGSPVFTQQYILLGNIDSNISELTDSPQSGSSRLIEVNDRRALDAVWRNNLLWLTTTIDPYSGPDAGQTTAYWICLDTSNPANISLEDQGTIGGEDIDPDNDVFTFFPSLAVNAAGDAYFGFSASSAGIYPGAYCAGRKAGDTPGAVRGSETVHAGTDSYLRTFGTYPLDRNRWGDYSGSALDPADENLFWIFNEYAMTQGTPTGTPAEEGRWATAWAAVSFVQTAFINGADVSLSFQQTPPSPPESNWPFGQFSLNSSGNGAVLNIVTVSLGGSYHDLGGSQPFRLFAANTNNFPAAVAIGTDEAAAGSEVTFSSLNDPLPAGFRYYWVTVDLAPGAGGTLSGTIAGSSGLALSAGSLGASSLYGGLNSGFDVSLPVQLAAFRAEPQAGQILLTWMTHSEMNNLGFIIKRAVKNDGLFTELSSYSENENLRGQGNTAEATNYSFIDDQVENGLVYFYLLADVDFNGRQNNHGPLEVFAEGGAGLASVNRLGQNHPNPFNPITRISYQIQSVCAVDLSIYNTVGQRVATLVKGRQSPGNYYADWDAGGFAAGIYFYRLTTDNNFSAIKKLILLK